MSSGFVTETEVVEARKKRQEEWEKVRQPDEPLELPEDPYDSRCLFERLKEQKDKRDLEYEEAHKLKNMIRGLDDDEIDFLEFVDRTKMNAEKKKLLEDHKELEEFRQRVATLQEKSHDDKIHAEILTAKPKQQNIVNSTKRLSQQKSILSGVVVKKRKISETTDDNKLNSNDKIINGNHEKNRNGGESSSSTAKFDVDKDKQLLNSQQTIKKTQGVLNPSALKVIGILPGLGNYKSGSSSESEDETAGYDWVGRIKIKKKKDEC